MVTSPTRRRILAIGGGGFTSSIRDLSLDRWALSLTGSDAPAVCLLPTASGDPEHQIERFYSTFRGASDRLSHISLFRLGARPGSLRRHLLGQDAIYVGGGSLVNLLALWRAHGLEGTLAEAWERGVLLCGVSAGAMCWFDAAVTRSHGPPRASAGLGLIPGSLSVHHDSDPERRAAQRGALRDGLPGGYALDDGVGLLLDDSGPALAASARPEACAYRCELENGHCRETVIEPTRLDPVSETSSAALASIDELRELRQRRQAAGARGRGARA